MIFSLQEYFLIQLHLHISPSGVGEFNVAKLNFSGAGFRLQTFLGICVDVWHLKMCENKQFNLSRSGKKAPTTLTTI